MTEAVVEMEVSEVVEEVDVDVDVDVDEEVDVDDEVVDVDELVEVSLVDVLWLVVLVEVSLVDVVVGTVDDDVSLVLDEDVVAGSVLVLVITTSVTPVAWLEPATPAAPLTADIVLADVFTITGIQRNPIGGLRDADHVTR